MSTLDQLEQRVQGAIMALRNDMIAAKTDGDLLPYDDITTEKTDDGVTVKFVKKAEKKSKSRPATKDMILDES